jgi:hypothetical protein
MSKLSETETAEVLLMLGRKNLLQAPAKALTQLWIQAQEGTLPPEEFSPDSQMAADEATYRADLFQAVTEMLSEQEITTARLREIAEAGVPWIEREFVMQHDPS